MAALHLSHNMHLVWSRNLSHRSLAPAHHIDTPHRPSRPSIQFYSPSVVLRLASFTFFRNLTILPWPRHIESRGQKLPGSKKRLGRIKRYRRPITGWSCRIPRRCGDSSPEDFGWALLGVRCDLSLSESGGSCVWHVG